MLQSRRRNRFLTRATLALAMMVMIMTSLMVPVLAGDTYQDYIAGEGTWEECKTNVVTQVVTDSPKIVNKIPKSELPSGNTTWQGTREDSTGCVGIPGATTGDQITPSGLAQLETLCKTEADKIKAKSRVDDISEGFAMTPDIRGANAALDGLLEPISLMVGILCVVVMIAMTALTASDLIYITVPFFREKSDSAAQNTQGHGMMANQSKRTGESKARWVTDEAYYAVRQSVEAGGNGRNPLWVYLWKRMGAFIALGIVMYILFTGNITLIVSFVINIISGFMGALGNLGN